MDLIPHVVRRPSTGDTSEGASGGGWRIRRTPVSAWGRRVPVRAPWSDEEGEVSAAKSCPATTSDVLHDPHRVAAARRLIVEVAGPAVFDRLSSLAARLLNAGHAKVTIFTDEDTVVGGYGLPPGVVG